MAPLVEIFRTLKRSVAATATDPRSVLIKGVARQLHPRILRFGSRFIAGINPDPQPVPIASRVLTHSEPASRQRCLVTKFGAYSCTGFTVQDFMLRPPLEIGLISRAHGELRPRSAPVSRSGLPARTPISPRLNRAGLAKKAKRGFGSRETPRMT